MVGNNVLMQWTLSEVLHEINSIGMTSEESVMAVYSFADIPGKKQEIDFS